MANLYEAASFDAGIYQIETTDRVLGGAAGTANRQAAALANRTLWLKQQVEALQAEFTALVAGAPGALDTLNELSAALGNDANFASTVTNALALKAPIASPTFTGTALVNGNGLGYGTGSGGAVTQATSKSTGVTLDKAVGQITMNAAALAASTSVRFTLTNARIAPNDVVVVNIASGGTTLAYWVGVEAVAAGSCGIVLRNVSAGSLSEAVVINFAVIKGASA